MGTYDLPGDSLSNPSILWNRAKPTTTACSFIVLCEDGCVRDFCRSIDKLSTQEWKGRKVTTDKTMFGL